MENKILDLEKSLFKYNYISDKDWLNDVIHKDFIECGKSGYLFKKDEIVEYLSSCKEDRNIVIYNYECKKIDVNTWVVHYITCGNNKDKYYRTSIWVKEENFKIIFHQASKYIEEIELKIF